MSDNVTEKIQVLVSSQDMTLLNSLIMMDALHEGNKPVALSTFVRELIKDYINNNIHRLEQRSFAKEEVQRYIRAIKEESNKTEENE